MTFPGFWNEVWAAALVNHLWQSTVAFLIAWLLALALRRNQARTRYWVWMVASVKFLLPFSLLIATGETLRSTVVHPVPRPTAAAVMKQITQPFPVVASSATVDAVTVAHPYPNPVPLSPFVVKKGSNIRARYCGSIPLPVSAIEMQ